MKNPLTKSGLGAMLIAAMSLMHGARPVHAEDPQPLGTGKHEQGLTVEVLEARPTNHEELMIRWRYRNTGDLPVQLVAATPPFVGKTSPPNTAKKVLEAIYYTEGNGDGANAARHTVLIEVEFETNKPTGKKLARDLGAAEIVLRPGRKMEMWALFSLPKQKTAKTITLHLPDVEAISGITLQPPRSAEDSGKDGVLAIARHDTGLVVEVVEVKPSDGNLSIRWRYRNETDEPVRLLNATPRFKGATPTPNTAKKFIDSTFYIEGKLESGKAFHQYIQEGKDLGKDGIVVGPNKEYEYFAKFSMPATKDTKTITLCLLGVPPIRELAIQIPAN